MNGYSMSIVDKKGLDSTVQYVTLSSTTVIDNPSSPVCQSGQDLPTRTMHHRRHIIFSHSFSFQPIDPCCLGLVQRFCSYSILEYNKILQLHAS